MTEDPRRDNWLPASLPQQGIWLHEQREDIGAVYHMPFTLSFKGELDTTALRAACRAIVARHPILACAADEREGVPYIGRADHAPDVVFVDLRNVAASDINTVLNQAISADILCPFDLRVGPLIRMRLFAISTTCHVLLIVVHHLIFDGLSIELFKRDLAACYQAQLSGSEPKLPRISYCAADYLADEQRHLAAALPGARDFWRVHWREAGDLALPGGMRLTRDVDGGECVDLVLDRKIYARLDEMTGTISVTKFEFLLATLYSLLYRYGNDSPVITISLGLRTQESAHCIGFFAQEVPVTTALAANMTFQDVVRNLRADLRELYKFRGVPVNRAIATVGPAAMQTPVYVSYRRHDRSVRIPGLEVSAEFLFNFTSRGALWIQVLDESERLRIMLRYPPTIISRESIERIAEHWRRVFDVALSSPGTCLESLPLLSPAERGRLLALSNQAASRRSQGGLVRLFSEHVGKEPEKIAAVCGPEKMTYARLDADSTDLARRLRREGIGPESLVAISAQRSTRMLTGMLAVLKSGGAYLLLDPGRPDALDAAADAGVSVVLMDRPAPGRVSGIVALAFEDPGSTVDGYHTGVMPDAHPTHRAYVVHTVDPAARMVGVEVEHGALMNRLDAFLHITGVGPTDTWLALAPTSSGAASLELLLPLMAGARVVIATEPDINDGARLLRLVDRYRVTYAHATPSVWQLLLDAGFDDRRVSALISGERLPLPLAQRLRRRVRRLWNIYGQSETATWSTCAEIPPDVREVTIGRPIANGRIYLLDNRGEMLPMGLVGELCIGGDGLARGYLNNPTLTAGRFLPDSFGSPGSRLYRTGDRARYRADGNIEFIGGTSGRVEMHGHRVELAEVEARLAAHPQVARCAVVGREDEDGDPGFAAYFVPEPGMRPPVNELREWMAETLPGYMRPTVYIPLDRFPRTPNGKLDISALPRPGGPVRKPVLREKCKTGHTLIQQTVSTIWQEVLHVKDIGAEENLFDFGVNSLTITQIASRIQLRMGVEIPLDTFYEVPTIMGIAELIADSRQEKSIGTDRIAWK